MRDKRLKAIGFAVENRSGGGRIAKPNPAKETKAPKRRPPSYQLPAPTKKVASKPPTKLILAEEAVAYDAAAMHLPLADLRPHQCRWAVNQAALGEPHLFCGHPRSGTGPYCEHHTARASGRAVIKGKEEAA